MKRLTTSANKKFTALQSNVYFQDLDESILLKIASGMVLSLFYKDEVIFWEGAPCAGLHFIHTGRIKLFKVSPQGRELILQTFGPGITFNEVSVFDGGRNPVSAAALEDSEIWVIDPEILRQEIKKHPSLALSVINQLTSNLRMLVERVEELTFYQVTHRLAKLIDELPADSLEGESSARLTQEQIAARLGTVREVVGRSLKELERAGVISVSRGKIHILDRELLESWLNQPDLVD